MFRPDLYHPDDPAVLAARARASTALSDGIGALWLNKALPPELGNNPETTARAVAAILFRTP